MKKLIVSLCVGLLIMPTVMAPSAYAAESIQSRKMIITFAHGKVNKDIVLAANGKVNKEYTNIDALAVTLPGNSIKRIENAPDVISVEMDVVVSASGKLSTSLLQPLDWGVARVINDSKVWESTVPDVENIVTDKKNTGAGVKVAVLDTGIAPHPDLVIAGGVSTVAYTTSSVDDNGHGTHVAGIIAAKNDPIGVVGVAPDADLYAVKVLDGNGTGYLTDVIEGIDWAITNKMDIINMSLGAPTTIDAFGDIIDEAYGSGILIVAAAGNTGTTDTTANNVEYPAKYGSVIAVAATDKNDTRASFSSTGEEVEVSAPGVSIKSTYLRKRYATMSGTSMATPMVAGNLALLKQVNPTATIDYLRNLLHENVLDLGEDGLLVKNDVYGFGLIQARQIVRTN